MSRRRMVRQGTLIGVLIGLLLAVLDISFSAVTSNSFISGVVRLLCYPALELAYLSSRVFFPRNHIGPGHVEVIVSDALLCLISALIWGLLGAAIASIVGRLRRPTRV